MVRKILIIVSFSILTSSVYADLELGLSYTPGGVLKSEESEQMEAFFQTEQGVLGDSILGFHAGFSFWWLFYVSADSLVVPPWWVKQTTSYTTTSGEVKTGVHAPGFINFFDVGIRPSFGPLYLLATIGMNHLYVHSAYSDGSENQGGLGVNLRIGAGLRFKNVSIVATGTSVYNNFEAMQSSVQRAIDGDDPNARPDFLRSLMPSIGFTIHLEEDE